MRTSHLRLCLLLVILSCTALFFSNCAAQQTQEQMMPTATPDMYSNIAITGQAEGAPEACTMETVTTRLVDLATAVNQADPDVAENFFGGQWFCTVENGELFTAYTKAELEAHLQRRYLRNEQWQVLSIQFNGWESQRGLIHFGPVAIKRTADDLNSPFVTTGKGAYSCRRQQFDVLCLGGDFTSEASTR